ncbi:flagellar hook-length control protein FliK [Nisaea denitrificans]|uniref:flagellar hook-length control protein FliK n=1 Tax=Nisaea denitrificans TaxID=390877 RepID=UPI000400EBA8|nr:flagellar hook-length control protein FliK [Nisaea denitrificans]
MSPVSTTNDPSIGYTGKIGNGLGFDPIAARNPDRPKFRLDNYNEANEPQETKPSRTSNDRSERDPQTVDTRDQRQSYNVAKKQTDAAGAATAASAQDKPETKQTQANVQTSTADVSTADANAANAETTDTKNGDSSGTTAGNADSVKKPAKDQSTETSAPYVEKAEGATDEDAEGTTDVSLSAEVAAAASAQNEISASEVAATSVPEQEVVPESSTTATVVVSKPADAVASTGDTPEQPTAAAAQKTVPQEAAVIPASTSRDPKLAALEKLTQTRPSTATTTPSAVSGDDATTFKLPVPWPPQTQSEATPGKRSAPGQTTATTQTAVTQPQATSPTPVNQATMPKVQPAIVPADAEAGRSAEGSKQATMASATQTAGETKPKIEIVSQTPAKPATTADTALVANNRSAQADGPVKQTALPSPSETIAAATALNSRPVRSNALGSSDAKRSNAVTASNENNSNGAKAGANQGQPNPAIVSQTNQNNPAAAAVTTATQGQPTVTTPEQLAAVRQQSSSAQRGQADPTGTTSNTSRAADLPAQGTNNGFADTLRSASADRTAATQDRQTLPTPATEQVKVKLIKAALGGLDKIKIQLNPSELGKVEIRLEIGSDGAIRGTVIADKPETMELLQRDAKQLERALHDAGLKTGGDSLDFQMRGGGTNERQQQQAGSGNGPLSQDGGDLDGSDEQPVTDTTGSEHDGIGDDGSLNLVA